MGVQGAVPDVLLFTEGGRMANVLGRLKWQYLRAWCLSHTNKLGAAASPPHSSIHSKDELGGWRNSFSADGLAINVGSWWLVRLRSSLKDDKEPEEVWESDLDIDLRIDLEDAVFTVQAIM